MRTCAIPTITTDVVDVLQNTRQGRGVNKTNLVSVVNKRWDNPTVLCANARSLSVEKLDELSVVSQINGVSCIGVTETWYKDHVPTAAVNLQGYACERKDRADRIGGGVAFYLKSDLKYKRLLELESSLEVIWVRVSPCQSQVHA